MRSHMRSILLTLVILSAGGNAQARISGRENTGSLFKKADVVIKGEVISIKDAPPASPSEQNDLAAKYAEKIHAKRRVGEIRIDRLIKGDISASTVEVLFYENANSGADSPTIELKQGEYLIVFLKQLGQSLTFLDLDNGKMSVPKGGGGNRPPKIEARKAMREELLQLVRNSDPDVASSGIQSLGELGEKEALMPELKKLRSSRHQRVKRKSVLWLARSGDRDSLKELVADIKADKDAPSRMENLEALDSIGDSKDSEAALSLVELLSHPDKYVRRKAMESLRKIKNPKTLPAIAGALDDSDQIVQYDAMMTMCMMSSAKPQGCPSTILFKANPDKYVSEWKAWWASHKDTGR